MTISEAMAGCDAAYRVQMRRLIDDSARSAETELLMQGADSESIDEQIAWFRDESERAMERSIAEMHTRIAEIIEHLNGD